MAKWHVNAKGVPSICRAKEGNCPFGNQDSHYTSEGDAQKAATSALESKHGLLGETKKDRIIQTNAATATKKPYSLNNFVRSGGNDYFSNIVKEVGMDGKTLVDKLNKDKNISGKWSLQSENEDMIELQSLDVFGNKQSVVVKSVEPPKVPVKQAGEYQASNSRGVNSAISNYVSNGPGGTAESKQYIENLIKNANGNSEELANTFNNDKRVFGKTWTVKEDNETDFTLGHVDGFGNKSTVKIYK